MASFRLLEFFFLLLADFQVDPESERPSYCPKPDIQRIAGLDNDTAVQRAAPGVRFES
jgi:hypothetical protein